jgi:hypothetical protein
MPYLPHMAQFYPHTTFSGHESNVKGFCNGVWINMRLSLEGTEDNRGRT